MNSIVKIYFLVEAEHGLSSRAEKECLLTLSYRELQNRNYEPLKYEFLKRTHKTNRRRV